MVVFALLGPVLLMLMMFALDAFEYLLFPPPPHPPRRRRSNSTARPDACRAGCRLTAGRRRSAGGHGAER